MCIYIWIIVEDIQGKLSTKEKLINENVTSMFDELKHSSEGEYE